MKCNKVNVYADKLMTFTRVCYVVIQAVGKLINYLDSNLMTLNSHLLRSNFRRILNSIWQEVLEEFDEVLSRPDEVCLCVLQFV